MCAQRSIGRACRVAFAIGLLAAISLWTGPSYSQGPAPAEAAKDGAPDASVRDLSELLAEERQSRQSDGAVLSIKTLKDGTVEVRNTKGELLESYPPGYFVLSGRVGPAAREKLTATREAQAQKLSERKKLEEERAAAEMQVEKETKAAEETAEKEKDARWREDFATKSQEYTDRKSREQLNAVKIDAREIREDGTYLYDGKPMKPVRLWNNQRKRYEMAIPVPKAE